MYVQNKQKIHAQFVKSINTYQYLNVGMSKTDLQIFRLKLRLLT